ncbi:hypothetical protein [Sulfurovum riftiae]|nr:hypothetical protein [Sulfurovum riftiae]
MKTLNDTLNALQRKMFEYYMAYRSGRISQNEYLFKVRSIDKQIDRIELSVLRRLKFESS